jgi:hypothetical protein
MRSQPENFFEKIFGKQKKDGQKIEVSLLNPRPKRGQLFNMTQLFMDESTEKFTIKVTDHGVVIAGKEGNSLEFSASEALMLLDILKNEESGLRKRSEEASPLSLKIKV